MRAVRELLAAVDRATSAHEVKLRVLDHIGEVFGAGALGIYVFGPDGNLTELHSRGVRDGFILVYEQLGREHDPILARALATRHATDDSIVFEGDAWQRSPLYRECGGPWLIEHYLCVPLVIGGQIAGTINLGRRSAAHPFDERDRTWASELARRVGRRIDELSRESDDGPRERPSIEDLGRLAAERTRLRLRAGEIESSAPLPGEQARALWQAMTARELSPLDMFEHGDRTYVLLPVPEAPAIEHLTPREIEVARRAAAGLADKEIAFELAISPNTVAAALRAARSKLGVRSRVALIAMVRRLGL